MTVVTTWHLEMTSPDELKPVPLPPEMTILECETKLPAFNRFLYTWVGADWQWIDRLAWSDEAWARYVIRDELRTFVGYVGGAPAGYYELEMQAGNAVEIAYFGLGPPFIGRGLGSALLSHAIATAWEWGAARVWVHTCSLDHPSALRNYRARGMVVFLEEQAEAG